MTPNQYRCETCNHLASDRRNYCNFLKNEIHSSPLIFIELCGCASHSSFQSERDKVLDTDSVLAVLKKRYHNEMAILDYIEMIECEVMALRQEGEP